jgi:DNA-binding MarR family transcriptional regulator
MFDRTLSVCQDPVYVAVLTAKGRAFRDILAEVFRLRAVLVASSERIAEGAGLTSARWQILGAVEGSPATVAHIARTLGVTRQAVQETADAMERDGLVTFTDNPDHKRARLMTPTAAGRRALDTLRPRQIAFANLLGASLTLDSLGTTLDLLRRTRGTLETHGREK